VYKRQALHFSYGNKTMALRVMQKSPKKNPKRTRRLKVEIVKTQRLKADGLLILFYPLTC